MAQIFALMPVYGILSNSSYDLRFSWGLVRTWYAVVITVCFAICSGFNFAYAIRGSFNFDSVESIIFYTSIFLIAVVYFMMARKWPLLMQQWQQVERDLPQQCTEMDRSWVAHRIKMLMMVAVICSLGEHLLSILTIIYYVNRCPRFENQPLESFLFSNFAQFFYFFEYTTLMGILGKIINVLSTFAWSFNDIFVMCLCVALTAKFRQLNVYMEKYLKKPTTKAFWIERRKNYRMLCRLLEAVDDTIAVATLLCLSNNLYFICNKILKSLQKKPSFTHTLYFWYSLIFILGRTFIMALYAAAIHEESKRPLTIFRRVKREFWCSEDVAAYYSYATTSQLPKEIGRSQQTLLSDYLYMLLPLLGFISCSPPEVVGTKKKIALKPPSFRMHVITDSGNVYSHYIQEDLLNQEYYQDKPPRFFQKATRDNFLFEGSFHEAVGRVLIIAECFAVMPVRGVTMPHPRFLSFSWSNVRTVYCLAFVVCISIDCTFTVYKVLTGSITFNNIEPMIFRFSIIMVCLSALNLARQWPELMLFWHDIETKLPPYTTQVNKRRMSDKIRMVFFVGMMLSLGEHLLSIISNIFYSKHCPTTGDPIKNFFLLTNKQIFYFLPYSPWLGWYGKCLNVVSTFVWNYMDVFVMIMSIGVSSKFEQLNENLNKYKNKQMSPSFWSERRIQYRNLCILCEKVDNAISLITMVSFSNNLYFICVQLLKSLNKMPSSINAVYFYFSLIFLLGRTLAVSLYSASIHDESRKPLRILRCVPKESWCLEVKRFAEEISSDLVALSGMKFFHLTRKLVLSVAGTIVTYELVLIQFHEATNLWDCDNLRHSLQHQQELVGGELRR